MKRLFSLLLCLVLLLALAPIQGRAATDDY